MTTTMTTKRAHQIVLKKKLTGEQVFTSTGDGKTKIFVMNADIFPSDFCSLIFSAENNNLSKSHARYLNVWSLSVSQLSTCSSAISSRSSCQHQRLLSDPRPLDLSVKPVGSRGAFMISDYIWVLLASQKETAAIIIWAPHQLLTWQESGHPTSYVHQSLPERIPYLCTVYRIVIL